MTKMWHAKTGKYALCKGKKKHSVETVPEKAQILDLLDKNLTSTILNRGTRELEETVSKELKEVVRVMYHKEENINR